MTANELIKYFNETFGLGTWPETFEVNPETYANCCQFIFNHKEPHIINNRFMELQFILDKAIEV